MDGKDRIQEMKGRNDYHQTQRIAEDPKQPARKGSHGFNTWTGWLGLGLGLSAVVGFLAVLGPRFASFRNHINPKTVVASESPASQDKAMEFARASTIQSTKRASKAAADQRPVEREELLTSKEDKLSYYLTKGNQFFKKDQIDEAEQAYRKAVEVNPHSEDAHFNLGIALVRQNKLDEAIAEYREALRLMPDYAEVHNNLGNVLMSQKKFDEAMEHFRAAIRILPEHASAHNNLGTALARQGRFMEAIELYEKAVEFMPDYVEARFNLGNAYLAINRPEQAVAQFNEVLRLRPDFKQARLALDAIRSAQNPP